MKLLPTLSPILFAVIIAGCASMQNSAPAKMSDGTLTNESGMTLYTFNKDAGGKSACNGPCATNWPPLMATDNSKAAGDYSVIVRDDGKKQWAYKGKPLYTWSKDQKPGDKTGDGFLNNLWHVAKP